MGTLLAVMDREGTPFLRLQSIRHTTQYGGKKCKILSRYQVKSHVEGFDLIFAEPALENRRRYALSLTMW